MLSIKGIFKNGTALPLEKVDGHDNQPVIITFLTGKETGFDEEDDWNVLNQLIESCAVKTGIGDLAHQHDHYLYGAPKKDE